MNYGLQCGLSLKTEMIFASLIYEIKPKPYPMELLPK